MRLHLLRYIACSITLFMFCSVSFSQSIVPTNKNKSPSKMGLSFDQKRVDFGKLKSTSGIQYATFTGTNVSDRAIRILSTDKSCGCLLGKITNRALVPGATCVIQLMLDPKTKGNGRTTQTIALRTDEPIAMPYYKLRITADIKAERMPTFRANNLIRGERVWVHSMVNSVSPSLATAIIDLQSPLINVHDKRVEGATIFLQVSTVPKVPRVVTAKVYVRDPTSRKQLASIPLFINVRNNYDFNTPSLFLAQMNAGEKIEKVVYMQAHHGKIPPIKEMVFDNSTEEQASAKLISEPGAPPIIKLVFHPEKMRVKIYRDTLRVKLKDKMQPEVTLVIFGRVRQQIPQVGNLGKKGG
jgi:Protein of unknown function (DUF1573)